MVGYRQPEVIDDDPLFSGARGVSEFAKREIYTQKRQEEEFDEI